MINARRLVLLVVLYAIQIILAYKYNYDSIDWGILFVNMICESVLFYKLKDFRNDFCSMFLFFSIILSVHVVALFQMYEENSFIEYTHLAIFGNELLCVVLFSLLFFNSLIRYKRVKHKQVKIGKLIPNNVFYILIIFSSLVSLLCMALGITRMGTESAIVLPFHLNGVLFMYRTVIVPYLLFVYVYNRVTNGKKMETREYVLMFLYGLLEVFVRLSKGALLNVFFPLFVFLIISRASKQVKAIYKYAIPVVVVFIFLFPVITFMRYSDEVSQETFVKAYQQSQIDEDSDEFGIYKRFFHGGAQYMDCYYLFNNKPFFDFSRIPMIIEEEGCAGYYTHVVKGISKYMKHSSGTTGITDPYLIGGMGLCFIVFILLSFVGTIIDRRIPDFAVLYRVLAIQYFYQFVLFKNLTTFLDSLFLSFVSTLIIQLLIIKLYLNKYDPVVKK